MVFIVAQGVLDVTRHHSTMEGGVSSMSLLQQ